MRPTRDQTCMELAFVMAQRGTCSRAQVGVVIAREGRTLVSGYNGAPAGMAHCDHTNQVEPGACLLSVHAEANAIAYAARFGISVDGATLYSTYTPCLACAQLIVNAGIVRVMAMQPYRDKAGTDLLSLAGIPVIEMTR